MFPENEKYIGSWHLIDINLHYKAIAQAKTANFYVEFDDVKQKIRSRPRFSHKGDFGHALIVAGSKGKYGAMLLATKACLRSGAGLVSVHSDSEAETILNTTIPEAMFSLQSPDNFGNFATLGIGPGLGVTEKSHEFFEQILTHFKCPMVIDADAINILAERKTELLKMIPRGSILTPHLAEFNRLAGEAAKTFGRLCKAREFAQEHNVIIVLKGANTAVVSPDGRIFFNSTGNPGMATGGSGDVLTGIIAALAAYTENPWDSAKAGVFIHGMAGDLAKQALGEYGMTAMDIADMTAIALRYLLEGGSSYDDKK
jgi:NAD(P)H-hydrate epimerase